MRLKNKKTEYYYKQFIRLKKIIDELTDQYYPVNALLNKTCWTMLEKYCDSLLKELRR